MVHGEPHYETNLLSPELNSFLKNSYRQLRTETLLHRLLRDLRTSK